jgi:hypothetical protein
MNVAFKSEGQTSGATLLPVLSLLRATKLKQMHLHLKRLLMA